MKSRTTPYHPQSDGLVERYNRTLLDMLAKAVKEEPFKWEEHLPRLCNTSVNQTTGYSPFFLMFGRSVRMPVDIMYGSPNRPQVTLPQYVADLRSSLTAAYARVRKCMEGKLDRQKELYNRRVHGKPFQKGDLVWLHTPAVPRGRAKKLHRPWTGPYRIVAKLSDAVYRIQHLQSRCKQLVVYFDRLKLCPPTTRLPRTEVQSSQRRAPSFSSPPIGTSLELADEADCPTSLQLDTAPSLEPISPAPAEVSPEPSPLPSEHSTSELSPLHSPETLPQIEHRYPRRERTQPDRFCPVIHH